MSEWRHEPWDDEVTLFRKRADGTEQGLYGWAEIAAYLNSVEQYKALADRFAGEARAVFESELEEDSDDALRRGVSGWLKDYDALKAQEAGQ